MGLNGRIGTRGRKMENEEEKVDTGADETVEIENKETNYEELISTDKKLQSFVDKKVTQGISTAVEKARKQWQLELDTEKTEAEKLAQMNETQKLQYELSKQKKLNEEAQKKLNARDLKDEAIKIATTADTAFDPEFLNLFDYENMTAEELQEKTKLIKTIQDRIVEKAVNEWSKEKPPYNPNQDNTNSTDVQVSQAFGNN